MGAPPTLKEVRFQEQPGATAKPGGDPLARLQRIQAAIDRRKATLAQASERDPHGRRRGR